MNGHGQMAKEINFDDPECLNWNDIPPEEIHKFFHHITTVMFDCDGVLWLGKTPLPGAVHLVLLLRRLRKRVFFITNNSTKSREDFLKKFNDLGFNATLDEIVSSSYLAALYLKEKKFKKKAYVIGTSGITKELNAVYIPTLPIGPDEPPVLSIIQYGIEDLFGTQNLDPEVGAVVVGFDYYFNFLKMFKAVNYLKDPDCIFIGTNTDEQFPMESDQLVMPGTGSIVTAITTASKRKPVVMGKPMKYPFELIQKEYPDVDPIRTLMIGDRGNTDISFGRECKLWTLLVLTGVTKLEEVDEWIENGDEEERKCIPHFYLSGVQSLCHILEKPL